MPARTRTHAFSVDLTACVAGNPHKAWQDGEEPDDVWEDQTYGYDDIESAKDFIRQLHPDVTTHVVLSAGTEVVYQKDAGDDLDAAEPGLVPESLTPPPDDTVTIPEAPPLMTSQVQA